MANDFAEALDIPAEDEIDHSEEMVTADEQAPEPEPVQDAPEPEPVQEGSGEYGEDRVAEEGSDTGDTGSEAQEAAEQPEPSLQDVLSQLEEMKKANSGLYSELKSEREAKREAKQLLDQLKERAEAEESAKKEAERAKGVPDKDEDPAGYLAAQQKQLVESVEQRLERMEQARAEEQKQQVFQQAVATVNADEERFRQEYPEYDNALNFARQERARLLRATHPDQPDEWINQQISNSDRMFALQSLQQGVSPAKRVVEYAERLGFKPGQSGDTGNGGQEAPAQAAPAPGAQPAQQAQAEKPKMTSLSAVSGKSGGGRGRKVTWEEYANLDMDRHDHRALFDKISMDPGAAQAIERDGFLYL